MLEEVPKLSLEHGSQLFQTPFSSFEAFVWAVLLVGIVALWLSPGGPAWARYRSKASVAIPGPLGSPLLGLLTVFTGAIPHRALAKLAKTIKAVKLMAFSVGFARFILYNDLETARDILDNNNSAFAYRPVKESAYELLFHRAIGFAPYGFRRETGAKMVEELNCLMEAKGEVLPKMVLHFGSLNNVMASVFGKKYDFEKPGEGFELEGLVSE
ncbi:hypothetical protein CXB51_030144 [Gossypium anomalum]|uniref:Uncharacterized protein n=1 Tax=Gossypium anomalum TaxID=47600 RepID=A0A8J6CNX7_9ROSI|nr:hypothetical protein CXB51_030144 [Gossypium anomalum]